jgi:hypothetical protein
MEMDPEEDETISGRRAHDEPRLIDRFTIAQRPGRAAIADLERS